MKTDHRPHLSHRSVTHWKTWALAEIDDRLSDERAQHAEEVVRS